MAEGEGEEFKVYVSRLPSKWTDSVLSDHFQACFGNVNSAEVFVTRKIDRHGDVKVCYAFQKGECDRGDSCQFSHTVEARGLSSGAVYFDNKEAMQSAIDQGSLHVAHRTVKITEFVSRDDGRDTLYTHS